VTLRPPQHRKAAGLPAVTLWAVQVRAGEPPTDVTPIAWLLLSTVEVHTAAAAIERVTWSACRWGMEVWHRILQSGCRMEARQLGTGERLQREGQKSSLLSGRDGADAGNANQGKGAHHGQPG